MARIRGYIGTSLDGFIAGPNQELDWLYEHGTVDYGEFSYERLLADIGTVVMGRATYDWLINEVTDWPYANLQSFVVTSRPLPDPPVGVTAWRDGIDPLIAHLRAIEGKDVWMVGGGRLQSAFVDRGALDYLEIFVTPVLIGKGVPLWPGSDRRTVLELEDARHIAGGVVRLAYRKKP